MSIIEVSHLNFAYSGIDVLSDLTFQVARGSFLAIAGPNGAGKSTLLNLLAAALKPKSGEIKIDAAPIQSYNSKTLAERVAVVRQEFVPAFGFSVIETVLMARTPHFGQLGFETAADRQVVDEALGATDTAQFADRPLVSLSGGERQRVFIARALAQNSDIMLLDEPTSFLDLKHQVDTYDLLKLAQRDKKKTIIVVTHDINLAAQYADEILLLAARGDYHIGPVSQVLSAERIEKVFDVKGFTAAIGPEKFFLPLGKFARCSPIMRKNAQEEDAGPETASS